MRLILFGAVYLSVRSLIEWLTPFYVGSDHLTGKMSILEMEKEPPSVFFIGSSRTHYHFNPALFDSVVEKRGGGPVRSFNLSQGFVSEFESVYIARELLKSGRAPACRAIFIEFNFKGPDTEWEGDEKLQERFFHRMQPSTFLYHARAVLRAKDRDLIQKTEGLFRLTRILGLKYLGVGRFRTRLMGTNYYREIPPTEILGRGFESMDSQYARMPPAELHRLRERFDTFDMPLLRERIEEFTEERSMLDPSKHPTFDSYFDDLIKECSRRGVRVYYTVQPNFNSDQSRPPVPTSLSDRVIDMTDPVVYPELYDWTRYYDIRHLNASGSDKISIRLAEIYLDKMGGAKAVGDVSLSR